ncbi:MAG: TonB-dependent receptor domain-containing protein [Ignavibacteria bacterium]
MKHVFHLLMTVFMLIASYEIHAQTAVQVPIKVIDENNSPLIGATVRTQSYGVKTKENGEGILQLLPGKYTLSVSYVGYAAKLVDITVQSQMSMQVIRLSTGETRTQDITVFGASRRQQKITEAPAAVSVVMPNELARATSHGQVAKTIESIQGVDVVQSGMNDFNVNMRGFNNSINRRVLVLLDGRDPSTPLLNLVEWNSFQTNMGDIASIEVVRGPGSALYGSNAYNGVINITSSAPKDIQGTRVSLTGGQFNTFRGDIRHAGGFGSLYYKLNAGYSTQSQSWVNSRDTTKGGVLEYPGLARDVTGNRAGVGNITSIDSLINANRNATNMFGSARFDYELGNEERVSAEMGFSRYGGEYFVNQTGRILINDVEKPYMRLAYNSSSLNVQAHWNRRNTITPQIVMNAAASSAERSDVYVIDAQWNGSFMNDAMKLIVGASHEYQAVNTSLLGALPLLNPDALHNNFSGLYAQAEIEILNSLKFVGAARVDRSTFFDTQFSPKAALVFSPIQDHTFRLTLNRSFLRPSYADLYRYSPAGAPVNLASIDTLISSRNGIAPLGLSRTTPQWNLGNSNIQVETAMSYEIGYKGIINEDFFVTVDAYVNRRTNFISVPLGGLAPDVYSPVRYDNQKANDELKAELDKINRQFYDRLARMPQTGSPALIITPKNIGVINEYGLELGLNYYIMKGLLFQANYAYLDFTVEENTLQAQKIVPNTSPHRVNVGLQYEKNGFEFGAQVRGVKGFTWVAGLFEGYVPEYWLLNLNIGYSLTSELKASATIFNALDRRHYQIFGGTILQRMASMNLTLNI